MANKQVTTPHQRASTPFLKLKLPNSTEDRLNGDQQATDFFKDAMMNLKRANQILVLFPWLESSSH